MNFPCRVLLSRPAMMLVVLASSLAAGNGRNFAGFYHLSNVQSDGEQVQANMTMRLFNYSGSDLHNVAITVRELPPGNQILAKFPLVDIWLDKSDVVIQTHLAISREEFLKWNGRTQPPVFIVFKDESGREFHHTAQVTSHPVAEAGRETGQ
ncbi:MAG: hypothetical protein U0Q18_26300 [Bryobacteraceae bacterium]